MSDAHGVARDQLRAFIERIERLEEEKKTIADDIKDVYGEAKSMGYDTKIMKQVIALRKKDDQERTEEDQIRDVYLAALGMIPDFEPEVDEEAPVATKQPARALQSPRKAAEAVAEMPRNNPVAKASVDNAATIAPETATAGREMRVGSAPSGSVPATSEGGRDSVERHALNSPETADGETGMVLGTGKERPLSIGLHTDGDPEARFETVSLNQNNEDPSVDSAETGILAEDTRSDANTGGSHVDASENAATHQAGVVSNAPAANPVLLIRPHCQHPGEEICGGSGRNHCRKCTAAMREEDAYA